jgi:hypothetical protein
LADNDCVAALALSAARGTFTGRSPTAPHRGARSGDTPMSIRVTILALSLAASAILAGCYRPQGSLMPATGDAYTYFSTELYPKTVRILDTRDGEVVFAMDIPVGKQLTLDFVPGEGDDPTYTPDLMRYEVFDLGTETGKLTNAMSVPNASSRKIEVGLREGPEYAATPPDRALRTDELEDRPDWWTPEGGELPEDQKGVSNYDK